MVTPLYAQVGAALSMTYVTGQPIIFVGTGQVSTHTAFGSHTHALDGRHTPI